MPDPVVHCPGHPDDWGLYINRNQAFTACPWPRRHVSGGTDHVRPSGSESVRSAQRSEGSQLIDLELNERSVYKQMVRIWVESRWCGSMILAPAGYPHSSRTSSTTISKARVGVASWNQVGPASNVLKARGRPSRANEKQRETLRLSASCCEGWPRRTTRYEGLP